MRRPEEEEEVISKLPEVPTEPPTLGRSEFNVPSLCDRSYGETLETEGYIMHVCATVFTLGILWRCFGVCHAEG